MGTDIRSALRPALSFILLLTLLTGLIYPLVILGIGQVAFPHQANGSLIRDGGRIVGSELIGQSFSGPSYFHPRPSAAGDGYDATASSGSNLGPTSADLEAAVGERVTAARAEGAAGAVPAHAVTASGSGLDPHISPEMARMQLPRVARARGLALEQLGRMVEAATEHPKLGILGEPRVNVLLLNRQLDRIAVNRQLDGMRPNTTR
jgi:potassium-transporting ATPase KdpC subunit